MKNMSDVRDTFYSMAVEVYGVEQANVMAEEFDSITSDGVEVFELEGFFGIGWMVYKDEDKGWTWKSYEEGEPDDFGDSYSTRAEALIAAATDAEYRVPDYVDENIADRIRAAI